MKYYLGIDGGGTRTTAAVSDESGKIIIKKQGKTINYYSAGMETARNNLDSLINEISTLIDNLSKYKIALEENNADGLKELLKNGRELKEALNNE